MHNRGETVELKRARMKTDKKQFGRRLVNRRARLRYLVGTRPAIGRTGRAGMTRETSESDEK